mgnify:CR=1 FL=1
MASKTTLNAKNLEALGAPRLAELLIEITTGDAAAKRRLRLELSGAQSPVELAREVRKRLSTIDRARSFVDWQGNRAVVADLDTQRRAIVETLAKADAKEALDLLWRFMALADSVFARCDDSNGAVGGVFRQACADLGPLAVAAKPKPEVLADQVYTALVANAYGQFDGLVEIMAPVLGVPGLDHLKARIVELSNRPVPRPADKDRVKIGWGSGGAIYADEIEERSRLSTVRLALMDIADALGDVDAFIAQYDDKTRKVPKIAADIAQRLLAAGRVEEALRTLDATEHGKPSRWNWPVFDWEDARIAVLDALGRTDDAQAVRWSCFERSLSIPHLRDYLKRLPDFDDVEAEEKALDHAQFVPDPTMALFFLISYPALERAADLVIRRAEELDGDQYEILPRAADCLAAKYPLAATLLLRALIDFSLTKARSSRYKHAARHLLECSSLAASITDFGAFPSHDAYVARLRSQHGSKEAFWRNVGG